MTNTIAADEQLLKTDARGRVRTPAARRESLLDEFEGSGLSGKKFAALVGVNYQTFACWAQKRRCQRTVKTSHDGSNENQPL
jgi:DNA-binding transcriptional regulator YiaG